MIQTIRRFNRYYTVWLNVLNRSYLGSSLSWPESRLLFELYLYPGINATGLCAHLGMDKSYVSRLLARFEKNGLLHRELVPGSKGIKKIYLSDAGVSEARQIDRRGNTQIIEKLKTMDEETLSALCQSMSTIEALLRANAEDREIY